MCVPGSRQRSSSHAPWIASPVPQGHEQRAFPRPPVVAASFAMRGSTNRDKRRAHIAARTTLPRSFCLRDWTPPTNDTPRMAGDALQAALLHCCGMQVWYVRQAGPIVAAQGTDYSTLQLATETLLHGRSSHVAEAGCHSGGLGAWQGKLWLPSSLPQPYCGIVVIREGCWREGCGDVVRMEGRLID